MRWKIDVPKKRISTADFFNHSEYLEMSGEQISCIIHYSSDGGKLKLKKDCMLPTFRIQPNDTHGSMCVSDCKSSIDFGGEEEFVSVAIDGTLEINSRIGGANIKRIFFPSVSLPLYYEKVEITAGAESVKPVWETYRRVETRLACEGCVYFECFADKAAAEVKAGETLTVTFRYGARFANGELPFEDCALEKRRARVEELMKECDFTCGDDIVDTMFSFAKVRAGESLFRTRKGLVHCPGGYAFYAAVWCNDQCEYSGPWFAHTADKSALKAARTAYDWFEPFMGDGYASIPSSVICEGFDNWGVAGDRGDVSMYLFGITRYYLALGEFPEAKRKYVDWCVEFVSRNITEDGVVFSDSDELENRISSGVNLATSSLAYGGLENAAVLYERVNDKNGAAKANKLKEKIAAGIESYFGREIGGYKTYRYHDGCGVIRAWNCLPPYMGILNRKRDTLKSIEERLWNEDSCRTTEGEKIMWDRSALYFMATLFRTGESDDGWEKLKKYSARRLLGDRVPYAVEAYPEGNMRHLSAESALYCRIITDGLLNIKYSKDGFTVNPSLPAGLKNFTVERIFIDGKLRNIKVKDGKVFID